MKFNRAYSTVVVVQLSTVTDKVLFTTFPKMRTVQF